MGICLLRFAEVSYGLAALQTTPQLGARDAANALVVFCRRGDVAAAQIWSQTIFAKTWLADRFALTAADARADVNEALREACANGHLGMATWLADRFALTSADARSADNYALRWACAGGHLGVATWLADRFALAVEDARANHNWALRGACAHGHLATVTWLFGRFGLTAADACAGNCEALWLACLGGWRDTVRFLIAPPPLGMGATPPQARARELYRRSARDGRHGVAQALADLAMIDNAWLAEYAALTLAEDRQRARQLFPAPRRWRPTQRGRRSLRAPARRAGMRLCVNGLLPFGRESRKCAAHRARSGDDV
jgi:hypothetical protein